MKIFPILLLSQISFAACPPGTVPDHGGCAYDDSAGHVLNEKPSHHPEPAWERGAVKIIEITPMTTVDDEIATAKKHEAKSVPDDPTAGKPTNLNQ